MLVTEKFTFCLVIALATLGFSCSAPAGIQDGSVDAGAPDASTDSGAGFDAGAPADGGFDAGEPQECQTCAIGSDDCGVMMSCREVGQTLGYCARFQPACDGGVPDLASAHVSYTTACSLIECNVDVAFNALSNNQMRVRVWSLNADGGPLAALDTETPVPIAAGAWREQVTQCLPASSRLQGTDCLTHQYQVRIDLTQDSGAPHAVEFFTGGSQLPSIGITESTFLTIRASLDVVADAGLAPR